jgi:hypothetical protein
MNQETRIKKISEIINNPNEKPIGRIEIPYKDDLVPMDVYKIPLSYLVYNRLNGRIGSRTKTFEKQNHILDPETADGKAKIEEFLYKSHEERNKKTLKQLETGQEKPGIITRDGIIIDGNRRAMLLNRGGKYDYFKTVVLPITIEENPTEIEKLETKFQLGEDQKLDYNPIEIYLKIQSLYQNSNGGKKYISKQPNKDAVEKVYSIIGDYKNIKRASDIEFQLEVLYTMEEYLKFMDYDSMYVALDDREEQFRSLTTWVKRFLGNESDMVSWSYSDLDVYDLMEKCYDLIRIKYKNEKFRYLAQGLKENHIFGNKEIWNSYKKQHQDIIRNYTEIPIDLNSSSIEDNINDRDKKFSEALSDKLDLNVSKHNDQLNNIKNENAPEILINKAADAFSSININSNKFNEPKVQEKVIKFGVDVISSLGKKSPIKLLEQIKLLLKDLNIDKIKDEDIEEVRNIITEINKISFDYKKKL